MDALVLAALVVRRLLSRLLLLAMHLLPPAFLTLASIAAGSVPIPHGSDGSAGASESEVTRSLFAEVPLGPITDLALGRTAADDAEGLIVASKQGFVVLDPKTGVERSRGELGGAARKDSPAMDVRILDVDGDGVLEFVRIGQHWLGNTALLGPGGEPVWVHEHERAVSRTVPLDADGDGDLEFLTVLNATGVVQLLDHTGAVVLSQDWGRSVAELPTALVHGDRRSIAHVEGKALVARSATGEVHARTTPPGGGFVNAVEQVIGFPGAPSPCLLVGSYVKGATGQRYHLYALDATTLLQSVELEEVESFLSAEPLATPGGERLWLTVRAIQRADSNGESLGSANRMRLVDDEGRVVHEDLCPMPRPSSNPRVPHVVLTGDDRTRILVGCGERLLEYSVHPGVVRSGDGE